MNPKSNMMINRPSLPISRWLSICSVAASAGLLLCSPTAHAVSILSNNNPSVEPFAGSYPSGLAPELSTGATYSWLTGFTGNDAWRNTDGDIIAQDPNFANPSLSKMQDGIAAISGEHGVFGAFGGSGGATIQFDLQDIYSISSIGISYRYVAEESAGISYAAVYLSSDGTTFSLWDSGVVPVPAENNANTIFNLGEAATDARYVQISITRFSDFAGVSGGALYQQPVLGEFAVFGDPIPEVNSAILAGIGLFVILLRRRKLAQSLGLGAIR